MDRRAARGSDVIEKLRKVGDVHEIIKLCDGNIGNLLFYGRPHGVPIRYDMRIISGLIEQFIQNKNSSDAGAGQAGSPVKSGIIVFRGRKNCLPGAVLVIS